MMSSALSLSPGNIIWGELGSYKWSPAMLINPIDCAQRDPRKGYHWVFWFGDNEISEIPFKKMRNFISHFTEIYPIVSDKRQESSVHKALEVLANRYDYEYESIDSLLSWANEGFKTSLNSPLNEGIPSWIVEMLSASKEEKSYEIHTVEKMFLSNPTLKELHEGHLNLEDVCIACIRKDVEIVAKHPAFKGGLCLDCKDRLIEHVFAYGADGKSIGCFICSKPGCLILCDNVNCSKSYCSRCIEGLISPQELSRIHETSPWLCFFCLVTSDEKGLLCIQADWEENLQKMLEPTNLISDEFPMSDYEFKKPINVLSLFDGISRVKVVLDLLGIEIANYFACEIDEDALTVSYHHHGKRIIYVGDVTSITEEKLQSICPIDLIIGGSPSNDLSLVNPCRKGIYDIDGTGQLFFDFHHILKMAEKMSKRHIFFLFENVFAMQKSTKQIISNFLQTEPIVVDSKHYTPLCRARYFWGNIPGMNMYRQQKNRSSFADGSGEEHQSEKLLQSCLMDGLCRKAMVDKIRTVDKIQPDSLIQTNRLMPAEMNGTPDALWATEVERIFGFPLHYTDAGDLSLEKRCELIDRSSTVPVLKNILYPLTTLFKTRIR